MEVDKPDSALLDQLQKEDTTEQGQKPQLKFKQLGIIGSSKYNWMEAFASLKNNIHVLSEYFSLYTSLERLLRSEIPKFVFTLVRTYLLNTLFR